MVAAIRQTVTVKPDGTIEVRSPELRPGEQAEVIVLLGHVPSVPAGATPGKWRRYAGALRSGDPKSADNPRIDEDLAREYRAGGSPER